MSDKKFTKREVRELLKPPVKVRVFYNRGNPNNQIRHIRAIVDKYNIVYAVWAGARWRYFVKSIDCFVSGLNRGKMKIVKFTAKELKEMQSELEGGD